MREGWHGLRSLRDPFGRGGAATLAAARVRARARAAALTPPVGIGIARSSSDRNERRAAVVVTASSPEPTSRAVTAEVVTDAATEGGRNVSGRSRTISPSTNTLVEQSNPSLSSHEVRARVLSRTRGASALASAVVAYLGRVLAWVRRKRPALSGIFEWLLRLHLTVFYFDGQYPSLAMRAVGARLMYTREQDEPRARYAILGLFSLLQAIGEVAAAASATFSRGGDGGGVAGTRAAVSGDAADGGAGADVDAVSVFRDRKLSSRILTVKSAFYHVPLQHSRAQCWRLFWCCTVVMSVRHLYDMSNTFGVSQATMLRIVNQQDTFGVGNVVTAALFLSLFSSSFFVLLTKSFRAEVYASLAET